MWMIAVGAGVMGLLQGGQIVGETDDVISCYAPSRWLKGTFSIYYVVSAVIFIFITASSLLFGIVHYVYIFRQLHNMKKNSRYDSNLSLKHNYQDIPIDWNSELRALNSMACMFTVSTVPNISGALYNISMASIVIANKITLTKATVPLVHITILCIYYVQITSPMVIIVSKRFRTRIKDLLKSLLTPLASHVTIGDIVVNRRPFHHHHEDGGIANSSRRKVLYNTWMKDTALT